MTKRGMRLPETRRRLLRLWAAGLLAEGLLLAVPFIFFVRPDPPIVEHLAGAPAGNATVFIIRDTVAAAAPTTLPHPPRTLRDSFFTVLHWPLNKPILEGGGRLIVMPMSLWWVPVLYVSAVPIALVILSIRILVRGRPNAN